MIFIFFANLMTLVTFFSYLFFTFVQNFKQRLIVTCVFECFQSYCCILKELHEFLCTIGAVVIFGENNFIFSFVGYGLVTKITWGWVHI
jgi:hypothetical protein